MAEERVQRRLAAILATDVVGYSRLMGADEVGTLARMRTLRDDLIDPGISRYHGRIVKEMGDGLLVEFTSVVDAIQCAVEIQRDLATLPGDEKDSRRIVLRIGVNVGDIIVQGDDIFGDGVNIASRLEGLAEAGGICISGSAHNEVKQKLDLGFEDLGFQSLKNIAEPVRVFRVLADGTSTPGSSAQDGVTSTLRLPDRPSVAVLPFDNMSGDPDQGYFSDGITEDIITELSRFPGLFVVARNSSFTYKGRPVDVREIRVGLGVRYVVEGSVRKVRDRVRVTVQLIDSETGSHLWADRYDRQLADIFDVQDELTQHIVATLFGRVDTAEKARVKRRPPQPMAAFDYLLAGRIHHHRVTREDNAEAIRLLENAIELDPEFAEAYAWKACSLGQALQFGFAADQGEVEEEAIESINRALSLDPDNVECHRLLCEVYMETRQLDQAVVHGARAIALIPNDPRLVAQQGELKTWLGHADEGAELIERAMRLDPHGKAGRAHLLGRALYGARRYGDALDAYRQITPPRYDHCAAMAACLVQIGASTEAASCAAAVLQQKPDFSISDYVNSLPYAEATDREHLAEGMRKAGLPE